MTYVVGLYNYWVVIFLMMTGFYIVIARSNLIQKVIGLNIFQISVFLLYITMGKVTGGTAPILPYHHQSHPSAAHQHSDEENTGHSLTVANTHAEGSHHGSQDGSHDTSDEDGSDTAHGASQDPTLAVAVHSLDSADQRQPLYTHPLPSVLMLTAIVVGVATTALALALVIRIGEAYGTIEEDEILQRDRDDS